jgi:hypothetical protein
MLHHTRVPSYAPAIVGVLAFWAGVLGAAWRYPTEFDWRYMTLSTLLSPAGNPVGHEWAAAGLGVSGLCWLLWAVALGRDQRRAAIAEPVQGIWALGLGGVCTACSGLLPLRIPGLPKGHEILTIFAFFGLCLGSVRLTLQLAGRAARGQEREPGHRPRFWGKRLVAVVALPVALTGLAQAYVFFARPDLHWVGLGWRARHVPVYLSFAFWEWVTCGVLTIYVAGLALAAAAEDRAAR